ncbi:ribokinase [Spiroplasma clarkii]|uniref:PfkB family carbohydrate kinase n=1 Tax=Spiroplasma clarkii TaxID=2139 RepID=UPI000B571E78|nr:PfkB family carbohydrate kinase [Spiroplasma clarkii]ARU91379.1 ribokinase [Spiroplasma clarkii]
MDKILVIGSINKDFTINVDKAPLEGETITSSASSYSLGGKGANQAVALARLEAQVDFIGKIGEDNNGYEAIESIQNDGVNMPVILKSQTKDTGIAVIILEKNGKNRIIVNQGVNLNFNDEDFEIVKKLVDNYDYFLIQLEINVEFIKN